MDKSGWDKDEIRMKLLLTARLISTVLLLSSLLSGAVTLEIYLMRYKPSTP
jgi:hypothetical protein